jgi:O-antigen/teichoic acid export membrane protein
MGELSTRFDGTAQSTGDDLKQKSVRSAVVAVCAQGAKFLLQIATTMLLARLLSVEDFGLQGMVLVLISFLGVFADGGLGAATIQRLEVTREQISTLFWINVAVGVALAASSVLLAPILVAFYGEPRLYGITVILGVAFIFNGMAAQHRAMIVRGMHFVTLAKIDVLSLAISSAVGVLTALLGWHYWALVAMSVVNSMAGVAGVWLADPWMPGPPRRKCGVLSMLRFGWMSTCNNFLVFLAWNADNMLVGRYWGADALGVYGRAYQLATMPVHQLNGAITGVAFSALSRIQNDDERLARSFLRGFSVLVSMTVPITVVCAMFADEIIHVLLGDKWMEAAPIFRLLAPTALAFALVNPLSWLVISTGRVGRGLSLTATTTPLVILGIVLGLSHGPKGVALGYSLALVLLVIPIAAWSKHGTKITWADLRKAVEKPLLAGVVVSAVGLIVRITLAEMLPPLPYLLIGSGLVLGVYAWVLLIAMGQKQVYLDLANQLFRGNRADTRAIPIDGSCGGCHSRASAVDCR